MPEKTVYIKFYAGIDEKFIMPLMNTVEQKLREGTSRFVILISSAGGNVSHGISAYNFLKGIPAVVETHNFGIAASMALVMFCAGKKRYSAPHATFLLHGAQVTFQQGVVLDEKKLDEHLKGLKQDMKNMAGIIAANTEKSEREIMEAMLNATTMNPEEAVEFGLVHEIKEPLFESGAELISIQG